MYSTTIARYDYMVFGLRRCRNNSVNSAVESIVWANLNRH